MTVPGCKKNEIHDPQSGAICWQAYLGESLRQRNAFTVNEWRMLV